MTQPIMVLASSSPRRQQILSDAGYRFEVVSPPVEEPAELWQGLWPFEQAEALAYFKARSVADTMPGRWVLGADTIVAVGGKLLGKPADADDARRMLSTLSGTRHEVITGVALINGRRRHIDSDTTYVTMRRMTSDEIQGYIDSQEWVGKAGAYAIQETADRFVARVEGSFTNVVGLPTELVAEMLQHFCPECDFRSDTP